MTSRPAPVREADTQKLVLDYLAAKRIWALRLNTGAMSGEHNGKRWFVKFGKPGMADILAMPQQVPQCPQKKHDGCLKKMRTRDWLCNECSIEMVPLPLALWLEIKSPTGKQSPEQKAFQAEVEAVGMRYAVIRNLEDLEAIIG